MSTTTPPRKTRRSSGGITLIEVAKLAGVAPITASRALNSPALVSPEVLQRVQQAVERTGYVPNRMAGSLASAKSRIIGAIVPSAVSTVFMETIDTLTSALFESGYQLMLGQSGYSSARQDALIESFIGRRLDGIFITGILGAGSARTKLQASGIPLVEAWDLTPNPVDMLIGFSHADVGRAVAHHLLRKKHRRFAVVMASDERAHRRADAFLAVLKEQRIKDVCLIDIASTRTLGEGRKALAHILQQQPDTDAVFCSSDLLALGVVTEAQARGILVPQQLAVVGFGDVPYLADMRPGLTTVRINGARIGTLAAQYLMQRAQGIYPEQNVVDIGFSLIERDTA